MKKTVQIKKTESMVLLASEIIYGQRKGWCNAVTRPLALSLIRPRDYFAYDEKEIRPLIVWVCGGAFTSVDRNVWMTELTWFAKRGYAVASVDYSVNYRSRYPECAEDVKLAIRYLKAHAAEYNLDTSRIALMGESAGGYLTAFCALTGKDKKFDTGGYGEQSSEVQAVVPWYPVIRPNLNNGTAILPHDWPLYADLTTLIKPGAPPFLILHGTADTQVPCAQGEELHDSLIKAGGQADLVIVEGAEHADSAFIQEPVKQEILAFINKNLKKA